MTITGNPNVTSGLTQVVERLHKTIIPPGLAELAIPSLECCSKDFVLGGPHGVQSIPMTHRFYQCDDEGFLMTAAGLTQRVVNACEQRGIAVPIIDRSRWPILEQAATNLPDDTSETDSELLQAIVTSPRGRIVAYVRDHFRLVSLICRGFATARVLVVTANREHRDRLFAKLMSRLRRPVSTHQDVAWGAFNRVTVITSHFFAGVSRVYNDFDVIVFLGADTVTGDNAYETASQLNNELVYCLVPPSYQPDELVQLRLEAICGPVIHSDVATAPTVRVVMLDAPVIQLPVKLPPLQRRRPAIWHNDRRNSFIAEIALATGNGDLGTSWHRSGFLNEQLDLLTAVPDPDIAILVESTEHGRELLRRLPHWTLNTANPDDKGAIDSGTCHRSIVTETFASVGIHTDVLIRATGTSSPLMVRGFPSMQQRRAIVLFDLADDFDAQAIRNTGERIADYRSRGWSVLVGNEWEAKQDTSKIKMQHSGRGV